jgi:hypothetical protein
MLPDLNEPATQNIAVLGIVISVCVWAQQGYLLNGTLPDTNDERAQMAFAFTLLMNYLACFRTLTLQNKGD